VGFSSTSKIETPLRRPLPGGVVGEDNLNQPDSGLDRKVSGMS